MPAAKTHPACTIHKNGMWLPPRLDKKQKPKNRLHKQKSHQKMANPRDIAGNPEEEEEVSRATLGGLIRDGAERGWIFSTDPMPPWADTGDRNKGVNCCSSVLMIAQKRAGREQ